MSKRINAILKYIEKDDIVLDVGCDMALLGIELAKKEKFSYASDLRKNIIESAIKKVESLNLKKFIEFYVSDGLKNINNPKINTLVLAGMGAHLIINIIDESKLKYNKIITISNNDHYVLRKYMTGNGYKIEKEEIIFEKDKFYNLIVFVKGKEKYSEEDLIIGVNHQNILLLNKKNEYIVNKYKKILSNIIPEKDRKRIERLIKIFEMKR